MRPAASRLPRWALLPAASLALLPTSLPRSSWDVQAFAAINGAQWMTPWAWSYLTVLGLGLSVFIILTLFSHRHPQWTVAFLICLLLAGGVTHWIKFSVHAPRPAAVLQPAQLTVIGQALKTHSMPSGHTVSAFALCAIVLLGLRRRAAAARPMTSTQYAITALALLSTAALISLSRIAVGAHWPSDVLVGAGLGWACGAVALSLAERWTSAAFMNRPPVRALLAAAQIGAGIAMLRVDTGYPLAHPLQWVLAALAFVGALANVHRAVRGEVA